MRRCYRGVALALGAILLASNTFSNSCRLDLFGVYAAEDTLTAEQTKQSTNAESSESKETQVPAITPEAEAFEEKTDANDEDILNSSQEIQTGEENVETEIPAEEQNSITHENEEENETSFKLEYNDYNVLLKIVEAEAGGEDLTGKMLVANVILNRVNSDRFPNTVTEVVYQKQNGSAQFSPTVDGRIDTVSISQETLTAVERVLNGEDHSNGALYFRSVRCNSTWFDNSLRRVVEHGNHIFYTI